MRRILLALGALLAFASVPASAQITDAPCAYTQCTVATLTAISNGAASTPVLLANGTILTGGSGTTNFPNLFIQPTGTSAATTWSTNGTGLGMNLSGSFAGNFLDFKEGGGGTSLFLVSSSGATIASGNITTASHFVLSATTGTIQLRAGNTLISSPATAALQFGAADSATPTAQTTQVQGVVAATTNAAGADWTEILSRSTGTGVAGNKIWQSGFQGTSSNSTVTITNASPAVFTWSTHPLVPGSIIQLTTTGTLPTGLSLATNYYVIATALATGTFEVSATPGGAAVNTSSAGSGTHTATTQTNVQNGATTVMTLGPASVTGSQTTPILNLAQTWNTSGNVSGLKFTLVNIAAGASSKIIDISTTTAGTSNVINALNLTSGGHLRVGASGTAGYDLAGAGDGTWSVTGLAQVSTAYLGWAAGSNATAAMDTTICRVSAGIVEIGSSTGCAASGQLLAATLRSGQTTVAGLPSASTAGAGARAFVTDATACTFASTPTGGAATACPVYSDGTNWKEG